MIIDARYLAGCDGARSKMRETIGTGFPGGTYRQIFYVADIDGEGPALDGELHIDLDRADSSSRSSRWPEKVRGAADRDGTRRTRRRCRSR